MMSDRTNSEFTADVPSGNPRLLGGIAVFSAVLLLLLSFYSVARIHDSVKGELQSLLTHTLTQTSENLHNLESERRRDLELWATTPDVVALTKELAAADGSVPRRLHLKSSEVLLPALKAWDGYSYAVVGAEGLVLTSNEAYEVGLPSGVMQVPGFMEAILAGRSIASRPVVHPEIKGHNSEVASGHLALAMYVGAPVKSKDGTIIGALVFELDPTVEFSHHLQAGRGRTTMETFAFNVDGVMLSESRFNDALSKVGLIEDGEYSILNVAVRDPGGDLRSGYRSSQPRESQPLTRVVQSALKGGAGVNLDGYRSYMGHEVIGAWQWDAKQGFGVVTEIQKDEAFAIYFTTRWEILGASGLAALLLIGLAVSFRASSVRASENSRRIQAILANVLDAIILIDGRGHIEIFNPAAERVFGYSAHEVIGKNVKILMPEPHHSNHDGYLANYMSGGERKVIGFARELEAVRKDGTIFPMELGVTEMKVRERRLFLGTVRDITERKAAERIKSEFVSTVSHELRTPLTSIHGSLGLLGGGAAGDISDQGKQLIQVAFQNSESLVHLIDDILDVEKLEAGKMIFALSDVGVAGLLTRAMDVNSAYADKYGVILTCVDDAPEARILVDADRFAQVIANLISNAVKFSPRGESVTITAALCDTGVRFSVTDHGPGVPEDFHDQIFQNFTQADGSDTRQKGGTGLGLSISKAIVEGMGGTIGFTNEEGGGATFSFIMPQVGD